MVVMRVARVLTGSIGAVKVRIRGRAQRWSVVIGSLVVGLGMLWASWQLTAMRSSEGVAWWQNVLVNVGAAFLLVVPIELISLALSRRVDEVQSEVRDVREEATGVAGETREHVRRLREETTQQVEEIRRDVAGVRDEVGTLRVLNDRVSARVDAERTAEDAVYRQIGIDGTVPDRDALAKALGLAYDRKVTSLMHGPRAELRPGSGVYLRLVHAPLRFDITERNGHRIAYVIWGEGMSALDVMVEVRRTLEGHRIDGDFDMANWFRRISETLVAGASHAKRRGIIELSLPQWAVTESGVVPYADWPDGRQATTPPGRSAVAALQTQPWVDRDSFLHAAEVWMSIYSGRGEPPVITRAG